MRNPKLLYSICLLVVSIHLFSQPVIPNKRTYLQYTETKKGTVVFQSLLTQKKERINFKGQEAIAFTQIYRSADHADLDSSICDAKSLAPLAYYSNLVSEGYKEEVQFTEKSLITKIIYKDSTKNKEHPNKHYKNGVVSDALISALVFKKDSVYTISVINPGLLYSEYKIVARVLGKEELIIAGLGKIMCWKLNVNFGYGKGSMEWYTEKEHIQLKKTFELPDGNVFKRVLMVE